MGACSECGQPAGFLAYTCSACFDRRVVEASKAQRAEAVVSPARESAVASDTAATNVESPRPAETRCPACRETILDGARKCKHCGEWFDQGALLPSGAVGPQSQQSSTLAILGGVSLLAGVTFLIYGMSLDTTVSTGLSGYDRVQNIGLMNEKQNNLLIGGVLLVVGAIFVAAGRNRRP